MTSTRQPSSIVIKFCLPSSNNIANHSRVIHSHDRLAILQILDNLGLASNTSVALTALKWDGVESARMCAYILMVYSWLLKPCSWLYNFIVFNVFAHLFIYRVDCLSCTLSCICVYAAVSVWNCLVRLIKVNLKIITSQPVSVFGILPRLLLTPPPPTVCRSCLAVWRTSAYLVDRNFG